MTQYVDKKVIIFNGPSGVGKSYAAKAVEGYVYKQLQRKCELMHMAEPLKKAVHNMYGLWFGWDHYDDPKVAEQKDQVHPLMLGQTPRQAYINMSNDMIARHGEAVMGTLAVNRMHNKIANYYVFASAGMLTEVVPIVEYVGPKNVLLVELHAEGKEFNDTRGYYGDELILRYPNLVRRKITNEFGGFEEREFFRAMCCGVVRKFLEIQDE